jgi:hemerythrin
MRYGLRPSAALWFVCRSVADGAGPGNPLIRTSWQELLPTGWDAFDREHEEIVHVLGALLSAVNAGDLRRTREAVQDLLRVVQAHFQHEERLMRETGYPQLAQHKEAHDLYLGDVAAFARHLADRGLTPEFRRWSMGRVLEWFRFHVSANDVALGAFITGRRRGITTAPKP